MKEAKEIAILDFGSQYTHLIARRVRELGVVSHIYPNEVPPSALGDAMGIILSGGPKSTLGDDALSYDPGIFELGIPMLGLCYGHQLMAKHFGGTVNKGAAREYGLATLNLSNVNGQKSNVFQEIAPETTVWMSHGDHVEKLPTGFIQIATTGNDSVAAMANENKKFYGFQFHPEVHHTKDGKKMLENFLFGICGAEKNWTTSDMLAQIEEGIKRQAEGKKVFLLLSGGVDSTVCFALLEKVLGKDRVYGFHVDHGFMRRDESAQVQQALAGIGITDLHVYNAEAEFLEALKGVTEPEQKRKIIGNLFLDIADRAMEQLPGNANDWLLGQGTIYPDTIESGGTKNADKIKTHHNRVDRIHDMVAKGQIIEPIKELYKDEVREIGAQLGLPKELLSRHPFPGPGLAIRCLCADESTVLSPPLEGGAHGEAGGVVELTNPLLGKEGRTTHRSAGVVDSWEGSRTTSSSTASTTPRLRPRGYAGQAARLGFGLGEGPSFPRRGELFRLPIKSVGVQGDERSYAHPAVIVPEKIDWDYFRSVSPTLTNKNKDINRVLFLLAGDADQLTNAKVRPATLTKDRIEKLRKIDTAVNDIIRNREDCKHIWQMPVVLIPFGYNHDESVVLRPVESEEAMTVKFAELPTEVVDKLKQAFFSLNLADFLFYDITNKPPGTIEWE